MSSAPVLRDFQDRAVAACLTALRTDKRSLLVMATGLGKTVIFASVIARWLDEHPTTRVLVLSHREELVMQARKTIELVAQQPVAVEMGDYRSDEHIISRARIIVSTIQTQCAGRGEARRMARFEPDQFSLVIIDEAHHAPSSQYKRALDYYARGSLSVLGVTATPDRYDGATLRGIFGAPSYEYGIKEGIDNGWLVPIRQRIVNVGGLDFSACRTQAGDLHAGDLRKIVEYEEVLHGMVHPTIELAGDRRCIVFCASVAHAERVAEIINRHRAGAAGWVCGDTPRDDRRELFRNFSSGRLQYLVNVGVATEGWDDAALDGVGVSVIAMMRPTKSRALYSQCIGRATRPAPNVLAGLHTASDRLRAIAHSNKPSAMVLDYCGNAGRHKLVHAADALGASLGDSVTARARKAVERRAVDQEVDVLEALTKAEVQELKYQESKQRRGIIAKAEYGTQDIDPFSLIDLAPDRTLAWSRGAAPTDKQIDFLRRLRVGIPDMMTKSEAGRLITAAISTPTPKQAAVLLRHGLDPADYDRRSASAKLSEIFGR